ncbi:MAG: thioredoxin domain-containing protein [Caldilineaceae bacterium]
MKLHKAQLTLNLFWLVVGIVIGIVLTSCIRPQQPISASRNPVSPLATVIAQQPVAAATPTRIATVAQPEKVTTAATYAGMPVGFTQDGYPYRGSPTAPFTLNEYSDFQCPFCERYFSQTEAALNEKYVRTGQLRVIFRDFPLEQIHPNALAAHIAARCVGTQSASLFWQMHDQLFQTQAEWSALPDAKTYFAQLAARVGADRSRYNRCVATGNKGALVEQSIGEGAKAGLGGTPSFQLVRSATGDTFPLIGAQPFTRFADVIDSLAAGKTPPSDQPAPAVAPTKLPDWATAASLAPDPAHSGYDKAGDEVRGNPNAPVTVIELSDFQCPFCQHHVMQTQPVLDKQFIATGKVRWVFKHFPLDIHPQALPAAVAAECAAEQGKFWEMHDALFTRVNDWSITDPTPVFTKMAEQLGLKQAAFVACLQSDAAKQRVQRDRDESASIVQGTPTFIVVANGQIQILPGALPAERFSKIIQPLVDKVAMAPGK